MGKNGRRKKRKRGIRYWIVGGKKSIFDVGLVGKEKRKKE
jgi:hypothetical protein